MEKKQGNFRLPAKWSASGARAKKEAALRQQAQHREYIQNQVEENGCGPFLEALGVSPLVLTDKRTEQIKAAFPIPREQSVLWADAEFDLRPSGIACTEQGVFIRSNVELWNPKGKNQKKEAGGGDKSMLFYYPWADFDPLWFVDTADPGNRAMSVEKPHGARFILACQNLTDWFPEMTPQEPEPEYFDIDPVFPWESDGSMEAAVISGAAVESAQIAVFAEHKSSLNTMTGHGEMAEEAITMLDKLQGLDARVVGRDNAKDGADRLIGQDLFIQTKYCATPGESLGACFNKQTGQFRYLRSGKPMQIEVPKDQYQRVLEGLEKKILEGKVPGVSDPGEAANIVRKGRLSYRQAVNLTKPGTIESLTFDAATGAVTCGCALGLTFVVTVFLTWRRTGNLREAIQAGASAGIQVFGISFLQHMAVSQIARTGLANALLAPSRYIVNKLGSQASATIVNGIRVLTGKGAIYGAAAKSHLAKILRSNVLTSAVTFVMFSVPDTYNLAAKKISAAQYAKNLSVLAGSIAGGSGGAIAAGVAAGKIAGAAGTTVAPGVGTAIGLVGGFVGGSLGAKAADLVGDVFHEDDSEAQSRLFNAIVSCMMTEYLLDGPEMDRLVERLDHTDGTRYREMFRKLRNAASQESVIREFLTEHFELVVEERAPFRLPEAGQMVEAILEVEVVPAQGEEK